MRVVIDTNVLIAAIINRQGLPAQIMQMVATSRLTALYDDRIMTEYTQVMSRPALNLNPHDVHNFGSAIVEQGEYVSGTRLNIVLPDPKDLPFLEVAVAGMAEALITGNARHFKPTKGQHNVRVCSPADFLRIT